MWGLILCLYFAFGSANILLAQTNIINVDCKNITSLDFSAPQVMYRCTNDNTLIIHTEMMKFSSTEEDEDMEWIHLKQGKLLKEKKSNKPLSSCLNTIRGGTASKSVTLSKGTTGSLGFDLSAPFFDVEILRVSISPSANVNARLETQAEYKCDVKAGEVLQILSTTTTYKLMNWKYRPIWGSVSHVDSGDWIELSNDTVLGEFHEVSCVSTPATGPGLVKTVTD